MSRYIKVIVSGKVTDVGYRHFIKKHADKLSVEGYIKNNEDGSVIIYAFATSAILDNFMDFVYKGSAKSEVKNVEVEPMQTHRDFRGVFRIIGDT